MKSISDKAAENSVIAVKAFIEYLKKDILKREKAIMNDKYSGMDKRLREDLNTGRKKILEEMKRTLEELEGKIVVDDTVSDEE